MEIVKKRSGRPKKKEEEKVQYQRIAVYLSDYERVNEKRKANGDELLDAFKEMANWYCNK